MKNKQKMITETRKVSITLHSELWEKIDYDHINKSAFLRYLITNYYNNLKKV